MSKRIRVSLDEVVRHFEELEDPRSSVNRRHPLVSVLVIAIMAGPPCGWCPAGAAGPTAIAKWAVMKAELLSRLLPLPHGVPRKDVYRRVRSDVEAGRLSSLLRGLAASIACPGFGVQRRGPADSGGGRQDAQAQSRPQQRIGRFAFGQRLGERLRRSRWGRWRRTRNRTKSRPFPRF